ncbi:MAG TPA: hypothetical protein VGL81_02365 [Polyangiaceae bacterium]|jgi:hypothetical protein
MSVTLRDGPTDLRLLNAHEATQAERGQAWSRQRVAFWLRGLRAPDPWTQRALARLAWSSPSPTPAPWSSLARELERIAEQGRLLVVPRERPAVVLPIDDQDEETVLGPEPESLDLEFIVTYSDGTPVQGYPYVLTDPGGSPTKGKLPTDGTVTKKDAAGTYALALVEIDVLAWTKSTVRAKQEATLGARVSGIDDGAAAQVKVYRLYDEAPESALATLSATVKDKQAQLTWSYTPASDAESGVAQFVAEMSFDGGKVWKKSDPLRVALPAVRSVDWSAPEAYAGDDLTLTVTAPDFEDGAAVTVTLMRQKIEGDESIGDLPAMKTSAGKAQAALHVGDATLPAKSGDVYAKVTVKKDGVERAGTSPLLWVSAAPRPVADETDTAAE